MYLRSFNVQHYKSLDNVTVNLEPDITIIVGPNGVGKSNFVDALRFLHDAVVDDLEDAITKREGIGRLLQSYKTKPYVISMQCKFGNSLFDTANSTHIESFDFNFRLKAVGESNYSIADEKFSYVNFGDAPRAKSYDRSTGAEIESRFLWLGRHPNEDTKEIEGNIVAKHIIDWNYCTIYPNTLKKPALPDRNSKLKESGENWASVIRAMKGSAAGKRSLDLIYDAMRVVLPTFDTVTIRTVGAYLVPHFRFKLSEDSLVSFDPVQLSDGTLRLFGILLAAYQVPRPKLLVIEEPEQTIYPGALAVLADVFKEVALTTQVLITTHSPHLVQFFKPEQIRVAVMQDGLTKIRPIHPHQMEAVNEGLLSLEEFMNGEGLRPDDVETLNHG